MYKYFLGAAVFVVAFALCAGFALTGEAATLEYGELIKGESFPSVYYYAENGKRYVFPNEKTYFTWYDNFNNITTITDEELGAIQIGGHVTYRPGYKMIKITTSPKTYAVEGGGVVRWVKSEELAETFYGLNWKDWIDDVPDAFYTNYREGESIETAEDYDPEHQMTLFPTISHDKGFVYKEE